MKNFDYKYYLSKYKDLRHFNKEQALLHLKTHGLQERRKFNKLLENFDYNYYINKYNDLKHMNYLAACNHYIDYGIKEKRICFKTRTLDNKLYDFNTIIINNNIKETYVSLPMFKFKDRYMNKYKLNKYTNEKHIIKNIIVFGVYNENDINFIKNCKDNIFVILGGSDFRNIDTIIKLNKNIKYLAISKDLQHRLLTKNIESIHINFNLVDTNIFKPMPHIKQENIYVYDGTGAPHCFKTYNVDLVNKIISKLPQFNFIISSRFFKNNKDGIPNYEMAEIYASCFIGLRLTEHDGNANTVQEFEAMNIPIVHNQSNYGLKWNNIDDIINLINSINKFNKNNNIK